MQGRFPYKKLDTYAHMGPNDAALWERYMLKFPDIYDTVSYDEWVGEGAIPQTETDENTYKKNLANLTKFRIDALGFRLDGSVDCIELRPRAGLSAIGHTLGGAHLFRLLHPNIRCYEKIITDTAQSDMHTICEKHGIKLIELDTL